MSQPAVNLVCTRATDGNHIALRRWYADHVHLLLAAPELRQATLYRCNEPLAGQPPDYFCIYEFASYDDFLGFEHGQPKARATELTNAATGRSSIEIVQRTQYLRWLHRQWPVPAKERGSQHSSQYGLPWHLAVCLSSEAGWTLDAQRWLADHLQALQSCSPLISAQAFCGANEKNQAFIKLEFAGGEAKVIWPLLQDQLSQSALYGQLPQLETVWAARAAVLQEWLR